MANNSVPREKIIARLNKIEGQIRGIKRMVGEERDCLDIITQLAATNSAMQSVASLILKNYATICARREEGADLGADLAHAVSIWLGRGKSTG